MHPFDPYCSVAALVVHIERAHSVVQDVKAFMDLKHQENSEKADIAFHKAHLATLEANTARTLEKMQLAAAMMRSHQAPGEQLWP